MRSKRLVAFLLISSLFLSSCQLNINSLEKNQTRLYIHAVEYYSRVPVQKVKIVLISDIDQKKIDEQYVDKDGQALFKGLVDGETYHVYIYQNDSKGKEIIQSSHSFEYDPSVENIFFETSNPEASDGISVPLLLQNPELPNGCEITSLTSILNYYGEEVSKMTMVSHFLPMKKIVSKDGVRYGPNPNEFYVGYPGDNSNAFYAYAKPIVSSANNYLNEHKIERQAYDFTGTSTDQLKEFLNKGIPVLTWVTIDWAAPKTNEALAWIVEGTGEKHVPYINLHAVVLIGMDEENAYIMNPLKGYESIPIGTFNESFKNLGSKAVVVF